MNFYIVMQGRTFVEEQQHGMIWTQHYDKLGQVPHSWGRMKEVQPGDAIFHYVKGEIVAISRATSYCEETINPYNGDAATKGLQVYTTYEILQKPLHIKEHFAQLQPLMPFKYAAFQDNSDGNQGYLYPCNDLLALQFMELIADENIYDEPYEQLEFAIGPIITKDREKLRPLLTELETATLAKLRKTKKQHAQKLAPLWDKKCAVCGIEAAELLQASYSKPLKDATVDEQLDPYNGLLLCQNHHTLYQHGFIAFNGSGGIHISPRIAEEDYTRYGIHSKLKVTRLEQQKPYFKWHKKHILK